MPTTFMPPLVLELVAHGTQLRTELAAAGAEVGALGKSTESSMARVGKASKAGSTAFMAVGAAAAIIGVESVKQAIEFQKSTTLLQTAGGESAKNMKMVSDGIIAVSNDTGISAENMAEGMYIVEKSGNRGAAGLQVLRAAAEGATAEGVGVNTMATALTSVMASFNIPAKDAAKAMSALDRGAGLAKTTMGDFASSLSSVTPAAAAAHMSLPGVLANIATLTQHGTSAAEATQELAHTIMKLSGTPTAPMQNAMNQLGIKSQDLRNAMAGPGGLAAGIELVQNSIRTHLGSAGQVVVNTFKQSAQATANLKVELSKMPPQLKSMSENLLNGTMTLKDYTKGAGFLPLQQKQMASGFAATAKQAAGFNTLLTKGNQVTRNAAGALRDVMGDSVSFKTALMLTGSATDKNSSSLAYNTMAIKDITEQYNKGGKHIATYAETQATVAVQAAKLKAGLANIGIAIGTFLLPMVMNLVKHLQVVVQWIGENWQWLGKLALGIGAVGVAMKILNVIINTSPWMLVVEGVMLLVGAFVTLWNKSAGFREFWKTLWTDVQKIAADAWTVLGPIIRGIGTVIKDVFAFVKSVFHLTWGGIWEWFQGLLGNIGHFFKSVWNGIATWFSGLMTNIGHAFKSAWNGIGSFFRGLWNSILSWLGGILGSATSWAGRLVSSVVSGISSGWHNIGRWFSGLWSDILGWLGGILTSANTWANQLPGKIASGIGSAWKGIGKWFSGLWGDILGWFGGIFTSAGTWGLNLIGKIASGIYTAWLDVGHWFANLWNNIVSWAGDVAGQALEWGKHIISSIWDGIKSIATNIWDWLTGGSDTHTITANVQTTGVTAPVHAVKAMGGVLTPGWSTVGEEGPEWVHTSGGKSTVYSNPGTAGGKKLPATVSGAGGGTVVHQTVTVQAQTNASPAQIAKSIGWELRRLA